MALNDILRATITFTMPETTIAQWVWHYIQVTAGDPDFDQLATSISSAIGQAWNEIEDLIIDTVIGDILEVALWDGLLNQFDTLGVGSATNLDGANAVDEMLPHMDAALVKFFTSVGRSIGKKFVPGLVETAQSESILTAGALVDMAAFAARFEDAVVSQGMTFNAGNFNAPTETFREYTHVVEANALLAPQTRRRPGIGI